MVKEEKELDGLHKIGGIWMSLILESNLKIEIFIYLCNDFCYLYL